MSVKPSWLEVVEKFADRKSYQKKPKAMTGLNISFSEEQQQKLQEFFDEVHDDSYTGAIGGRYTFTITFTSLGEVVKCKDAISKKEVDLTEYKYW